MPRPPRADGSPDAPDRSSPSDLASTRTERTLRDVLHELPVDALVPDGWRVGCEVVQFGDRLPRDAVTLRHPDHPRDLVVTAAGADEGEALAVHERDRVAGRRTVVAAVPDVGDGVRGSDSPASRSDALASDVDAETLRDAVAAAARAAARIEGRGRGEPTVDGREPSASVRGSVENALRSLNFY